MRLISSLVAPVTEPTLSGANSAWGAVALIKVGSAPAARKVIVINRHTGVVVASGVSNGDGLLPANFTLRAGMPVIVVALPNSGELALGEPMAPQAAVTAA